MSKLRRFPDNKLALLTRVYLNCVSGGFDSFTNLHSHHRYITVIGFQFEGQTAILMPGLALIRKHRNGGERILAVISKHRQSVLSQQLAPLKMTVVCAERALEIAQLVSQGDIFQVAILPAASSHAERWALWGELWLTDPRPEILVYAQAASFELWTGVLDMGGFDVIVEPFSDLEIQEAVRRAIQSFKKRNTTKGISLKRASESSS